MKHTGLRTILPIGILLFSSGAKLSASIAATGTFTDTMPTPGTWTYDITLNNTGTTTIGTFWFSWIPGAGFMGAGPTDIQSPTGWAAITTNGDRAIQWKTTTSLLMPSQSMTGFIFTSTLSPTELMAPFAGPGLGTGDPTSTAFVYIAAPLADPGAQLTVMPAATTPEPSSLLPAGLCIAAAAFVKFARRRAAL